VIGWVVGGYLVASLLALARGTEPSLRWVLVRLGAWPPSPCSRASSARCSWAGDALIPGDIWALALIGTLVVFATSTVTTAFQIVFGELGIALAIVVFVVAGNPSAGGPYPRELLNGVWRAIGPYLPTARASTRSATSATSGRPTSPRRSGCSSCTRPLGGRGAGRDLVAGRARAAAPGSGEPTPLGATAERTWGGGD